MIRNDASIDTTEKYLRIREETHKAEDVYQRVFKAYEHELEAAAESALQNLFYVTPSNRDSVRAAYNDVYDRTQLGFSSGDMEGIAHAREEMQRLWERAVRTGDRELQTAIGHLAAERGMHELRDKWLATSEEKTRFWQRYNEAGRKLQNFQDPQESFFNKMTRGWGLRRPPEAGGPGS